MTGLGSRKRVILTELDRFIAEKGFSPSIREIATLVGLKSPSSVKRYLDELEKHGYLTREPSGPRTLRLLDLGKWFVSKEG